MTPRAPPLATMTARRVTNLYDLMDSAFDVPEIKDHSRSLGHVPIIDHKTRRGEKEVIVAEALYRAWSLQTGHPYHRE